LADKTLIADANEALQTDQPNKTWLCELVYRSTDKNEPDIRIVTNLVLSKENKVYIRDPSVNLNLWPNNFAENMMKMTR